MIGAGSREIDVVIQSQVEETFQYYLINEQKTNISLTSPVLPGDAIIKVSAGHGFTAAACEYIVIRNGDYFIQAAVLNVNVNDITITPVPEFAFPITSGVMRGNANMAVNGSVTPVLYKFSTNICGAISPTIPIDIVTIAATLQHTAAADDGKFGGIAALTKGVLAQKTGLVNQNKGVFITNQSFRCYGGEVVYTDKAPAGNYGTNIRFNLTPTFEKVFRIDPRKNEGYSVIIQDNLSGLLFCGISILGSYTTGE